MPVVTICNHKGGSGKTTTAVHLAAALGKAGRRVLVVDLDPQGFLTRTLGVAEPSPEASSLALLDATADLAKIPSGGASGFELIPASYAMTKALRTLTKPTDVFWLKETFAASAHPYDLVLLDTAAALSVFTMNALVASTQVVIPVTPEYQPILGAEQTWATCRLVREKLNPALDEPHFLLTQVDGRKRDHAAYARYLRETYGPRVLRSVVRTSAALAEAYTDGATVFDKDLASRGARDYANAADELAGVFFADASASRPEGDGAAAGPAAPEAWAPHQQA